MTKKLSTKKLSRRLVLRGLGGAAVSLPFLPSLLSSRSVAAADDDAPPFAIFFRQANGVAAAQNTDVGAEPERFWPRDLGMLRADSVRDRAIGVLEPHLSRLLVTGVDMEGFDFGDGHARGAMQALTARGPAIEGAAGSSEAAGESIDHRIGAELNEGGRDSLFLYAGRNGGWLGGPCISYRGPAQRRAAIHDPWTAYMNVIGGEAGLSAEARVQLVQRRLSVNDLIREQMDGLMARRELSTVDRSRLTLHFEAIQDLELGLICRLQEDEERLLEGLAASYDSTDGDEVLSATRAHMSVAALAVACGYTRSVAIQVGSGNDGSTRYRDPDSGALMENYHYLSHRRASHGSTGDLIANSDLLHHKVDVQFAEAFKHLIDQLASYTTPSGAPLVDCGVSVWYNDNGNGPGHSRRNVPFVMAGSCGGALRQGVYAEAGGAELNHAQLLNTLASAVGVTKGDDSPLDDFGDPSLPTGRLDNLLT